MGQCVYYGTGQSVLNIPTTRALKLFKELAVGPCVPIRGWRAFAVLLQWNFQFYVHKNKSLYISKLHCKPNIDTEKKDAQGTYTKNALVL